MPDPRTQAPHFNYAHLDPIERFSDVLDDARYVPVPDSWWIALSDVAMSTAAIEQGRYRAVNLANAAAIAAIRNALPAVEIPFVFGGDGASLLVPPEQRGTVEASLAATVAWARDGLGLTLRAALVPVAAVRAAGHDLRVARYAASADVTYAMFTGGGLAWAEAAMKTGTYAIAAGSEGVRPDLTGLSCRFAPVASRDRLVLSLIVLPRREASPARLRAVLEEILAAVDAVPEMGRPLPLAGPRLRSPWSGLAEDAKAAGPMLGSVALRYLRLLAARSVSFAVFHLGLQIGRFSPQLYRRQLTANADFRKYDDGLRLTVACPPETADAIEARLTRAQAEGVVTYGLHRQEAAIVTCITPSPTQADHLHFVDGAGGGYARAAQDLKHALSASR